MAKGLIGDFVQITAVGRLIVQLGILFESFVTGEETFVLRNRGRAADQKQDRGGKGDTG